MDNPGTSPRSLLSRWRQQMLRWMDRRAPLARQHKLTHKNLYVFPNRQGLLFLILVAVIWVMGTNYQNNLILGLSYLLISVFVASIVHTYANLAGIQLQFVSASPCFAGEKAGFVLELHCNSRQGSEAVQLHWQNGDKDRDSETLNLPAREPRRLTLWLGSQQRGYLRPGRLCITSNYPLGLIRGWTWLRLDARAQVYPQPLQGEEPGATVGDGDDQGAGTRSGSDEFNGLRTYVPGDSLKHIAWKQYAQQKGLFTKDYQHYLAADKWLDWGSLSHPQETRLSILCYWALAYEQQQQPYGLRLPGLQLVPALGQEHLEAVLGALALYNLPANSQHWQQHWQREGTTT